MGRKTIGAVNLLMFSQIHESLVDPASRLRARCSALVFGCVTVQAANLLLFSKYLIDGQGNTVIVPLMVLSTVAIAILAWQFFAMLKEHGQLNRSISALTRRYEEARCLADRDPVTGLQNQRAIIQRMEQELKRARRTGQPISIVIMDLDGFSLFNDTYGLAAGDQVLKDVASLLRQQGRGSDHLGRYGGDDYLVILPDTGVEGALALAERLRTSLAKCPYVTSDGLEIPLRMSFGISTYPDNGRQVSELVAFAGANLNHSKQKGGDTITVKDHFGRDSLANIGTFGVLDGLVTAVDHKDHYTRKHSEEVTRYAIAIGQAIGLSNEQLQTLKIAGLLHDVGKIGVPDRILRKPGRLDAEEFGIIKQHVVLGELIIKEVPHISEVLAAVGSHHERMDGSGYPRGLRGDEIPLLGRILAVADAYSAMTTNRPYHVAKEPEEAQAELFRVAGIQLDIDVVGVFLKLLAEGPADLVTAAIPFHICHRNGRSTPCAGSAG